MHAGYIGVYRGMIGRNTIWQFNMVTQVVSIALFCVLLGVSFGAEGLKVNGQEVDGNYWGLDGGYCRDALLHSPLTFWNLVV